MNRNAAEDQLGRREFVRHAALLGAGIGMSGLVGGCSDNGELLPGEPSNVVTGRKWIRFDSVDTQTGVLTSLDGFSDSPDAVFSSDVQMNGHAVLTTGEIVPVTTTVEKDCANSLSMRSLGGGRYHIESDGVPQPPGAPFEVYLVERTIPGTSVIVLTGYLLDPGSGKRVLLNITHDPIWIWIAVGTAIIWILIDAKPAYGSGCNNRGGPKSIHVNVRKRSSGGSGSNSVEASLMSEPAGITGECTTNCNHDQGGGS